MDTESLFNSGFEGEESKKEKPSPLVSLEKDLKFYAPSMKEVATDIRVEEISAYPIFVAHQHELRLGEKILDHLELGTHWTIHAATLEEFIEKGLIQAAKKDAFIKQYKDPNKYMCVFVVVPEGANFIFYPYGEF